MLFNNVDRLKNQKGLQIFTFKQLHSTISGFGESNVVGHGRFGLVYRGVLHDGRRVVVKLMDRARKENREKMSSKWRCGLFYALPSLVVVPIIQCPMVGPQRWLPLVMDLFSNCESILLSRNKLFSEGGNFANSFQRPILFVLDQTLSYQLESSITLVIGRSSMMCWISLKNFQNLYDFFCFLNLNLKSRLS
ncbi:unnamed protein product, partial [Vitis vinifera]|uniref:Protein kinase domain-containing protein n=1 Tax=Vitis vinifera TaxID=29760 RepID=E0CT87_VITVI